MLRRSAVAAAAVFACLVPTAVADVQTAPPGPSLSVYGSDTTATQSLSTSVSSASTTGSILVCGPTWPWLSVQNTPSGYATGNCKANVHVHRTGTSYTPNDGTYWNGGEIFGNYAGCGWIDDLYMVPSGSSGNFTNCVSPVGFPQSAFTFFLTSQNKYFTNAGQCGESATDGCLVNNGHDCPEYGNFRPWDGGSHTPTDYLRTATAWSNHLKWRYLTKYQNTNAAAGPTGYYYMVRDVTVNAGYGNWVFVPASCY